MDSQSTNDPMQYCNIFDEVKSVLEHCNRNVRPFVKLLFRGGNESSINEITNRLQAVLIDNKLMVESIDKLLIADVLMMRKVVMFLLVNTDMNYMCDLTKSKSICHVVNICPLLPKFIFVAIVWELNLDEIFYELLSYTPIWLSFQHFETAAESLKHISDPYDVLEKVDNLIHAIFTSIALSKRHDISATDRKIIYSKLNTISMYLLRQFYTPDSEKFTKFTKSDYKRYAGYALKHIMEMALFGVKVHETPEMVEPKPDLNIYTVWDVDSLSKTDTNAVKPKHSTLYKEQIHSLIMVVFNVMQNHLLNIDIITFISWLEEEITIGNSLQSNIGHLAYKLCTHIKDNSAFEHNVIKELTMFSRAPKPLKEVAQESTLGVLLRKLDSGTVEETEKRIYLNELFDRTMAFGNDECVETMVSNVSLMSTEHCKLILNYIKLDMDSKTAVNEIKNERCDNDETKNNVKNLIATDNSEYENNSYNDEDDDDDESDYEALITLFFHALEQCIDPKEVLDVLKHQIKVFGENQHKCFIRKDFQNRANIFWNLYNGKEFKYKLFLMLCLENSARMWEMFFNDACHYRSRVVRFCDAIRDMLPISGIYYVKNLNAILRNSSKLRHRNFSYFFSKLYMELFFPNQIDKFIRCILFKAVNAHLEMNNFDALIGIMKAINAASDLGQPNTQKTLNFGILTAPVLVMVAQVMDAGRWDLQTYTETRAELVTECSKFLLKNVPRFLPHASTQEREWLINTIKKDNRFRLCTRYYFRKFEQEENGKDLSYHEFILPGVLEDESEVEMLFVVNFSRSTEKEANWLLSHDLLRRHIHSGMYCLAGVTKLINNTNADDNYRHCFVNYCQIVLQQILPELNGDRKKIENLILKILKIVEFSSPVLYEELFIKIAVVLEQIIQAAQQFDYAQRQVLIDTIDKMPSCKGRDVFLKKLKNTK